MRTFTVKLIQFVEEVCEIEVQAASWDEAAATVNDSIKRNMIDEEFDLDWSDGDGIHHDGVGIYEITPPKSSNQ